MTISYQRPSDRGHSSVGLLIVPNPCHGFDGQHGDVSNVSHSPILQDIANTTSLQHCTVSPRPRSHQHPASKDHQVTFAINFLGSRFVVTVRDLDFKFAMLSENRPHFHFCLASKAQIGHSIGIDTQNLDKFRTKSRCVRGVAAFPSPVQWS